jgi:N-methylhydantoinase A
MHEERLGQAAARLGIPLSLSAQVLPEFREYECCSTTVVNAYLRPVMQRYLEHLAAELRGAHLSVMRSNGGIMSAERAHAESVHTVLSGPAGGVVGAFHVARELGYRRAITFDMGGTSTDVSLCDEQPRTTTETTVAGCPVKVPVIDIHTVGAGGGSLAYLDRGGALRVGPASAGADPGPAFVDEFHRRHEQRYGYEDSARPTQVVNVRVRVTGPSGAAYEVVEEPVLPGDATDAKVDTLATYQDPPSWLNTAPQR